MKRSFVSVALVLTSLAVAHPQDNVLVVVVDDAGVDRIPAYGEHPFPGVTPNIDQLAANGVLFRNAWVHPGCTTTRASLLTGRFPSRHGLGTILRGTEQIGLALSEITIPEMLEAGTGDAYATFAVGKWHLAGVAQLMIHPNEQGFDSHAGSARNIQDYYDWLKYVDGTAVQSAVYATTDTADEAIARLAVLPEPWFGWIAFNAPHGPFHWPPLELAPSFDQSIDDDGIRHRAALEALDTELGRILASIDPGVLERTTIVLVGDNGTPGEVTEAPFDPLHAKGTTFEGGVNVPLLVSGPRVADPGREVAGLVLAVDLFATVAEIAGVDLGAVMGDVELDSVSFLPYLTDSLASPVRTWAFTESFLPNGPGPYVRRQVGARMGPYKIVLVSSDTGAEPTREMLFHLGRDPFEQDDLLLFQGPAKLPAEYVELRHRMNALLATF